MPNAKSHGTDKRRHHFRGEEAGRDVVKALSGEMFGEDDAATKRVRRLFGKMFELDQLLHGPDASRRANRDRLLSAAGKLVTQINSQMSQYQICPLVDTAHIDSRSWYILLLPMRRIDPPEWWVIESVLELAKTGQLLKVRRCPRCNDWYFARFSHQRFCGAVCREKSFRSSDEWKKYRRDKAREYYWLHKNKNTK